MSDLVESLRFLGDRRREELIPVGNAEEFVNSDWVIEWQAADEIERLQARIAKLESALTRYATHDAGCVCEDLMDSGDIFYRHDWPCSCGYREAIAAAEVIENE